jgi:hypothetical protein
MAFVHRGEAEVRNAILIDLHMLDRRLLGGA